MGKIEEIVIVKAEEKIQEDRYPVRTTDDLLKLMEIYLMEWTHRDSFLWKQVFKYFFAVLIVILLPFVDVWGIDFGGILPSFIFPLFGVLLSLIFLLVGRGHITRLSSIGKVYRHIIQQLPPEYRRDSLNHICPKNFISNRPMAPLLVYTMFGLLFAFGVYAFVALLLI